MLHVHFSTLTYNTFTYEQPPTKHNSFHIFACQLQTCTTTLNRETRITSFDDTTNNWHHCLVFQGPIYTFIRRFNIVDTQSICSHCTDLKLKSTYSNHNYYHRIKSVKTFVILKYNNKNSIVWINWRPLIFTTALAIISNIDLKYKL